MKRLLVTVLLAIAAPFPPLAQGADDIKSGEEFSLLAEGPGKDIQATPAVAFGNGMYLVVWREGWHGKGGAARVYAARVSADGKLLDPKGIEVAPAKSGVQERPKVAFAGDTFLVVWQDLRNGKDYDVLGARIDAAGKVLDREPMAVAPGPRNQVLPDVGSDGNGFLVVWQGLQGEETSYRGFAVPVSVEGKIGQPVETGVSPQPQVAWNGSHYLVVGGGAGVQAVRLNSAGVPQGKPALVIRGSKAAAFCITGLPGKGWLVVNHRSPPDPWGWGGPGAIRTALINADGKPENEDAVKEPSGVKDRLPGWLDMGLAKSKEATWPWGPSAAAFDGKQAVVVWQRHHLTGEKLTNFENSDLIAARVAEYKSLDPSGVPVAAAAVDEKNPALASSGDGRLLLIYERQDGPDRVTISGRILQAK